MSRLGRVQVGVHQRGLGPPPSRRNLNLALMILCAVAAVSFTLGLTR